MPRILLLSTTTGYQLRSFGHAARELGVELVFATDRCHALDDPWRDSAIPVRFYDEETSLRAILRASRDRAIDGVIAVGDRPVVLAARAAEALGLPGHPAEAARASAHKRLARERFAAAGLPVPWFVPTRTGEDIRPLAATLRYPVVLKPAGLSGSRGVIRANTPDELEAAHRRVAALLARPSIRAERTGSEQDLVVEEFIGGREYAIEGLLTRGELTILTIFDKPDPLDGPFFEETIYVTPSRAAEPVRRAIAETVRGAARALGLVHGPVHAECRVNERGVFMLEVAARPIGGLCSRVLRFSKRPARGDTGSESLEHLLLRHAAGEDVRQVRLEDRAAAVMMIPIPRKGVFKSIHGIDDARSVKYVEDVRITAKPDQLLEPLPEGGSYLGFIFARAPQPALAEEAVREAHCRLQFTIAPAIDVGVG